MSSRTQDAGAEQTAEQRRRKRKERGATSRTPDPKNIVSGAGQPLDPGVRRELEEQLGHDLSRVRLHTGRDAGQLTELLGADAVAVGQDVFFREGAFKPGTDEGRRLLTHELQHTVQNAHGLGALRAGRELGAVSLPQQAIEREAEAAVQATSREEPAPQVEEGQATPAGCGTPPSTPTGCAPRPSTPRPSWTGSRATCCAACAATPPTPPAVSASNSPACPSSWRTRSWSGWRTGC